MPDTAREHRRTDHAITPGGAKRSSAVRLSPEELSTLKAVAARDGLSLPSALREGFLRYAEHCR